MVWIFVDENNCVRVDRSEDRRHAEQAESSRASLDLANAFEKIAIRQLLRASQQGRSTRSCLNVLNNIASIRAEIFAQAFTRSDVE